MDASDVPAIIEFVEVVGLAYLLWRSVRMSRNQARLAKHLLKRNVRAAQVQARIARHLEEPKRYKALPEPGDFTGYVAPALIEVLDKHPDFDRGQCHKAVAQHVQRAMHLAGHKHFPHERDVVTHLVANANVAKQSE